MNEISNALQENILVLAVFDNDSAQLIINNVAIEHFSNAYYRNIITKTIKFFNEFGEPPKEHIADLLENELKDKEKGTIYSNILKSLYESRESLNKDYVLKSLDKFIKGQQLKLTAKELVEALQSNNIDKAEEIINKSRNKQVSLFDAGTFFLKDFDSSVTFLEKLEGNCIYTGIKELDKHEICPAPKELFIFVGRSSSGKSWFLVHLSKFALLQRKKVLHISLELDEERLKARYFQNFFSLTSKSELMQKTNAVFVTDKFGNLTNIDFKDILKHKSLKDNDILKYLESKKNMLYNPQLVIKEFPTGTLSVDGLKTYLDNLEAYHKFVPDIILLDYLDLMSIDVERMRIDLGQTAIQLRGIAGERNIAMVTVAQTNKAGEGQQILTRKHLAEDFSKVRVADYLITYSATPQEREKGLARLFIDKARNAKEGSLVLISQNYDLGQFCLQSVPMRKQKEYFSLIENKE